MNFKVIHVLQAFSSAVYCTVAEHDNISAYTFSLAIAESLITSNVLHY